MNQRFAIPALCALLFHAVLLFGFTPTRTPVVPPAEDDAFIDCTFAPHGQEPIKVAVTNANDEEPVKDLALGNTDTANPAGEDHSELAPDASDFSVPL